MPANPELPKPELPTVPVITEHIDEFPAETIQQIQGARVVQKNFNTQVADDSGNPLIQTPPTQVITTINPPSDTTSLTQQSKGNVTNGSTWVAAFWLRILKKALHFGWKVIGASPPPATN